jgi:hypothetical protein
MSPQIQLALELLIDYYGEDYISSPLDLVELMEIDCDVKITLQEAEYILDNKVLLIDNYKNLSVCCVI